MSTSQELSHWMRKKPRFGGVYALDSLHQVPLLSSNSFIVNTETSRRPGEHWIAVKYNDQKQCFIFDPLPILPPPPLLINFLLKHFRHILVNDTLIQPFTSSTCGHHVVFYLYHNAAAASDVDCLEFINKELH